MGIKYMQRNWYLYDDVIINDDYNNIKGPEIRPNTATIIKVNEKDETSSVS